MDNCARCKWLDHVRTQPAGSGYCCMVVRAKEYKDGDRRRYPYKGRCELYQKGDWATRWLEEELMQGVEKDGNA